MKKLILFFSLNVFFITCSLFANPCTADLANAQVRVIINNHTDSSFTQISSSDSEDNALAGLIGIINARSIDKTSKYYLCCTREKTWSNAVVSTTYQNHLGQACVFSVTLGCEKYITVSPLGNCGRTGFTIDARYDPVSNIITYSINGPPKIRRN